MECVSVFVCPHALNYVLIFKLEYQVLQSLNAERIDIAERSNNFIKYSNFLDACYWAIKKCCMITFDIY